MNEMDAPVYILPAVKLRGSSNLTNIIMKTYLFSK